MGKCAFVLTIFSRFLLWKAAGVMPPERDPKQTGPKTVADLCEEPARYAGRIVVLEGVFQGWRIAGCRLLTPASPTITRSDWLIRTGEDCLYVTGGKPDGLDPINPSHIGRLVKLKAKVMQTHDRKVYLEYIDS
jgi:hypothetical protein